MSKRAKEAALKVFPVLFSERNGLDYTFQDRRNAFEKGYEQAEIDLGWHSVKESLPPIDEEVIVLTDDINGKIIPGSHMICYGHRPNPKGWDGKNIGTGKVTHYTPKTYDGWNIPGVTHWMYCPKLEEE